jgi:hypothetical protein
MWHSLKQISSRLSQSFGNDAVVLDYKKTMRLYTIPIDSNYRLGYHLPRFYRTSELQHNYFCQRQSDACCRF